MPDFGFVGPSYEAPSIYQDAQECINFRPEIDPLKQPGMNGVVALYPTPGLTNKVTLFNTAEIRGMRQVSGGSYMVVVCGQYVYVLNSTFKTNLTQGQIFVPSEYSGSRLQMLFYASNNVKIESQDNICVLSYGKISAYIPDNVITTATSGQVSKTITLGSVVIPTSSTAGFFGTGCVVTFDGYVRSENYPVSPATSNSFVAKIKASFPFITNASTNTVTIGSQAGVIESKLFENTGEFEITAAALTGAVFSATLIQYNLVLTITCTVTTPFYITGEVSVSQSPTSSSTQLIITS